AFSTSNPTRLTDAVVYALAPLWVLVAGALAARSVDALFASSNAKGKGGTTLLDRIVLLTGPGSALSWLSAIAIVAAVEVGWASLSVGGLMGFAVLHLVALWTLVMTSGRDPVRRASIARRFVPERPTEGAPVVEEIALTNPRIPTGFRLFATGCVGPRW